VRKASEFRDHQQSLITFTLHEKGVSLSQLTDFWDSPFLSALWDFPHENLQLEAGDSCYLTK